MFGGIATVRITFFKCEVKRPVPYDSARNPPAMFLVANCAEYYGSAGSSCYLCLSSQWPVAILMP
jgi:hypothetical protein